MDREVAHLGTPRMREYIRHNGLILLHGSESDARFGQSSQASQRDYRKQPSKQRRTPSLPLCAMTPEC